MLLQVFLQSGRQPRLQSAGGQSSLLLRRRLQCEQLCLPAAKTQLPAAVSASVVPLCFQVDEELKFKCQHPFATRMTTNVLIYSKDAT